MSGLSGEESDKMASAINEATMNPEPERHRRSPSVRRRRPRSTAMQVRAPEQGG